MRFGHEVWSHDTILEGHVKEAPLLTEAQVVELEVQGMTEERY
jgi:hypothetical protein